MDSLKFYKNKIVLVTGGAGAIGRNLCEQLSKLNTEKIIILDNLSSGYQWNIHDFLNILFIKGDIRNDDDLRRVFHHKPQIIFHLAAFFANQNSVDYPLINESVNTTGLLKVLEYSVLSKKVERFVFTNSEGGTYGSSSKLPYKESDISIELSSPYYISKLAGESYCNFYHRYYNLPVSIARLFNSYGPGEVPGQYRNVIPNFIFWAMQGKPLPLTGNKEMSRDFVFVDDIVEGLLRCGSNENAIGEAINLATGKEIFIYDIAELINKKLNNKAGVKIINKRNWDTREKIIGDTGKAKLLLNFMAKVDFEQGIDFTIEWFLKNKKNIFEGAEFPPGLSSALDVK